eukprot:5336807-Pleurochrysis_carterae.AAC.1
MLHEYALALTRMQDHISAQEQLHPLAYLTLYVLPHLALTSRALPVLACAPGPYHRRTHHSNKTFFTPKCRRAVAKLQRNVCTISNSWVESPRENSI